jgi:poly(3-hydroxybutyrate) depolymerase
MRYLTADYATYSMNLFASGLGSVKAALDSDSNPLRRTKLARLQSAALDTGIRLLRHYPKQGWGYGEVTVGGRRYAVEETVAVERPFCKLMKFRRERLPRTAPKVLFVAALSGHHATLSRETFEAFLPDHEVYVTDWTDARLVPVEEGRFGFEEYVSYVIDFFDVVGPGAHMVGICQAGVPGLVAAAVMSQEHSPNKPLSMSFLGSPMDVRVNPGLLSRVSNYLNPGIIGMIALHKVPARYPGRGRLVYPGMLQLSNFMSLNLSSHVESHLRYFKSVYRGNFDEADKIRDFYDEYFSILDCTAEFYVETLERVFMDQHLPKGLMMHRGKPVHCDTITDIPLFTVEGGNDNMVMLGQCRAAADFCHRLPPELKSHYVQEGVGHYGIFNGSKFREEIAPRVKSFIRAHDRKAAARAA